MAKESKRPEVAQSAEETMAEARRTEATPVQGRFQDIPVVEGVSQEEAEEAWDTVNDGEERLYCVASKGAVVQGDFLKIHRMFLPKVDNDGKPVMVQDPTTGELTQRMDPVYSYEIELRKPATVKNRRINEGAPFVAPVGKHVMLTVTSRLEEIAPLILEDTIQEVRVEWLRLQARVGKPGNIWIPQIKKRDTKKPMPEFRRPFQRGDLQAIVEGTYQREPEVHEAEIDVTPSKGALSAGPAGQASGVALSPAPKQIGAGNGAQGLDAKPSA